MKTSLTFAEMDQFDADFPEVGDVFKSRKNPKIEIGSDSRGWVIFNNGVRQGASIDDLYDTFFQASKLV